jgi:hypothetical protein
MDKKNLLLVLILIIVVLSAIFVSLKLTGLFVTSINTCQDTDNGKDYYTKGEVFGEYSFLTKENYNKEDKCKNEKVLVEYYCFRDDNGLHSYRESIEYECENRCEKGRCLGEAVEKPKTPSFLDSIKSFFSKVF